MSQNLTIGAFIFGAVLVLIAILGGNFKLLGSEVSATVSNPLLRFMSFILGAVFLILAMRSPNAELVKSGGTQTGSSSDLTSPTTSPQPSISHPTPNLDVSGTWRDSTGTVYQITQRGKAFEFTANNPSTGASSTGSGTINGREFRSEFTTSLPSSGSGNGRVSADGSEITGTFNDSSIGQYSRNLYR